jgi:uncharacterized pyridoxal phosphate-containing UPF0001 family protein
LERIGQVAGELGLTSRVLLEVNVSGETSKSGFSLHALREAWPDCARVPNVELRGLMTMAPLDVNAEAARPVFRSLRELREELRGQTGGESLCELSMGMSGDFEVAVEEGATIVRVGSAIFDGIA